MSSTFAAPGGRFISSRLAGRGRRDAAESAPTCSTVPAFRAPQDDPGWTLFERCPATYLDRVMISPSAVLAATVRRWDSAEAEEHVRRAWQDIRIATGAAKLLEISLDDDDVPVRPVLMLSGPGVPDLPEGHMLVKGVRIVDANRPELWMHLFDAPIIDDVAHRRLLRALPRVHLATTTSDGPPMIAVAK